MDSMRRKLISMLTPRERSISGNAPLSFRAKAGNIKSLKQYGKCVQDGTPTPDAPMDIVCNNGAVKVSPNLLNMNDLYGNYLLTDEGQVGNEVQNFILTNFIRVYPNTTYTFSFISGADVQYRRICGYSSANQTTFTQLLIKKARPITVDAQYDLVFTTDANTNYIRISTNMLDTNSQIVQGSTAPTYRPYGQIYTDGTVETITITPDGGTATAEMLLSVGDYKDIQDVIGGSVVRNVGVKVLDGTETGWIRATNSIYIDGLFDDAIGYSADNPAITCSHFKGFPPTTIVSSMPDLSAKLGASSQSRRIYIVYNEMTTTEQFQQFLADQYAAGTPVIIVYPLAEPTTESVTPQSLRTRSGNNTIDVDSNVDPVEIEVKYKN